MRCRHFSPGHCPGVAWCRERLSAQGKYSVFEDFPGLIGLNYVKEILTIPNTFCGDAGKNPRYFAVLLRIKC